MRRFCVFTLCVVTICLLIPPSALAQFGGFARPVRAPDAPKNWNTVNGTLNAELDVNDVGALGKSALTRPIPQDAAGWLRRLAILVRADYRQDALAMLKSRPRSFTRGLSWGIDHLATESTRYHDPQLTLRLCTLFPEEPYGSEAIDGALAALPSNRIDAWLTRQGMVGAGGWYAARIRYRALQGTEGPLLAAEAKQVRSHPADMPAVNRYLRAVRICRDAKRPVDVGWLSAVCRPRLAIEAFLLGEDLKAAGADPVPLYQHALATRFTPRDDEWYRDYLRRTTSWAGGDSLHLTERQLHDWALTALMSVYQTRGEHAKAQALLEELTAENKSGLPDPYQAFGAGQIQGSSGARVVELRIIAAESQPENQASPQYWLQRGLYYSGRKEDAAAVEAFEKALKLAPVPVTGGTISPRWDIVQAYSRHLWLRNIERPTDMIALLNREVALVPPDGQYAEYLFQDLANHNSENVHTIDPADGRLWAFLSAQKDWDHFVWLLKTLALNAPPDQQERVWRQAAALAKDGPTSRAYAVGEAEVLWGDARRAIPVLEEALPRSTGEQARWELLSTLWSARSTLKDWQGMADLLRKNPSLGSTLEIANAAAASGANADAILYFRSWLNQDRRRFAEFPANPQPAIVALLRDFYRQLSSDEPRCATPVMAAQLFKN